MSGWQTMLLALGWVLIIEGIGPLTAGRSWQKALVMLSQAPLPMIRALGAILVCAGLALVWLTP